MSEEPGMKLIEYAQPEIEHGKKVVWLANTDRMIATIQTVREGGETNLHAHKSLDGIWWVLSGRARFYSDETTLFADIGAGEGVLIPRGVKYWFESASEEPLQLFQVECAYHDLKTPKAIYDDRVDYTPPKEGLLASHEEGLRAPEAKV
jgi:mannose-6-phosphate isomerase-like protein (cupin superfamily)